MGNNDFIFDIYIAVSTDSGQTFSPPENLSNNAAGFSFAPQIAISGNNVYVVWQDDEENELNTQTFFSRSTDSGQTFSPGSFRLKCRNPDLRDGDCNFYYVTLGVIGITEPQEDLFIETEDFLSFKDPISIGSDHDLFRFGPDGKRYIISLCRP